jgi:3-deoxy-D-manno-octulosonic-acid transferase
MAIARRSNPAAVWQPSGPAPEGEVVWGHATSPQRFALLCHLATRLSAQRPDLEIVLTYSETSPPDKVPQGVTIEALPAENLKDIRRFLDHTRPHLCLWTGGLLRPALIGEAAARAIPLMLIDADESAFDDARFRWLPDITRATLKHFGLIFAASANAAQRVLKLGASPEIVTMTGPLQATGAILQGDEKERDRLGQILTGRPIWLAARIALAETEAMLRAHRLSLRGAHRQLLVIVPELESDGDAIEAQLVESGWRYARWSRGEDPTEATQILLADTEGEMGLWYRLAPVTFLGGSLATGIGGRDPFEPAALGSAVLYGPNVGRHLSAYSRLASAGAARIVKDAETLASAVQRLSAPDQAAAMAHAAWEVVTQGAEATDQLLDLIQDTLDLAEAP